MLCSIDNTVITWLKDQCLTKMVRAAAHDAHVQWCPIEDYIDLIAVPCFFAVIDPTFMSEADWNQIYEFYSDIMDPDLKIIFTKRVPFANQLPNSYCIPTPAIITEAFLRTHMLKQHSQVVRRSKVQNKVETRMARLMYMLRVLEQNPPLRLRDVALEFDISIRSAQRDLQILRAAGHPIDDKAKQGEYFLPKSYRAHSIY